MPINPQQRIEITHDILARQVYQRIDADEKMRLKIEQFLRDRYDYYRDSGALLEKRDLDYVGPYLDRVTLSTEQQKFLRKSEQEVNARARWKRRRNLVIGTILLIAAVGFAYVAAQAVIQSRQVDEERKTVQQKNVEIQAQADRAERALQQAREAQRRDSLTNLDLAAALRSDSLTKFDLRVALARAENETSRARRQAEIAEARRLTGLAMELAQQERYTLATQIALLAYHSVDPPRPASIYQAFSRIVAGARRGRIPIRTATFYSSGSYNTEFSPNGDRLLFATGGRVVIRDLNGSVVVDFPDSLAQGYATYSPDGRYLMTAGKDNTAYIHDLKTNNRVSLTGHHNEVSFATFSPDSRYLLTIAFMDSLAKVWDLRGKLIAEFGELHLQKAYFSPDNRLLVSKKLGESPKLWNADGSLLRSLPYLATYTSTTPFSPDGRWLATYFRDSIRLATPLGEVATRFSSQDGSVQSLKFHPDGKSFVITATDTAAKVFISTWNTYGERLFRIELTAKDRKTADAAFSADGRRIVAWTDTEAVILDSAGTLLARIPTTYSTARFRRVLISPDGSSLLTMSGGVGFAETWKLVPAPIATSLVTDTKGIENAWHSRERRYLFLQYFNGTTSWYTTDGREVTELTSDYRNPIDWLAPAADGGRVFAILRDNTAFIRDTSGASTTWSLPAVQIRDLAFSPTGQHVAYADEEGSVAIFTTQGQLVGSSIDKFSIDKIRFSLDGRQLLVLTAANVLQYRGLTGRLIREFTFDSKQFPPTETLFSSDVRFLAVRTSGLKSRVCDLADGTCFTPDFGRSGIAAQAFSPDGRFLALLDGGGGLHFVDLRTQKTRTVGTGLSTLYQLTFSPDGRYLAAANHSQGLIQLWHPNGTLAADVHSFKRRVQLLTFSPDGRHLIVVEDYGDISRHPLPETYAGWVDSLPIAPLTSGERTFYQLNEQ